MDHENRTVPPLDQDPMRAAWYSAGTLGEVVGGPQAFLAALAAQQILKEAVDEAQGHQESRVGQPEDPEAKA